MSQHTYCPRRRRLRKGRQLGASGKDLKLARKSEGVGREEEGLKTEKKNQSSVRKGRGQEARKGGRVQDGDERKRITCSY